MELLFNREQTSGRFKRVAFKLWGKIELTDDERALMKRYQFDDTILLYEETPNLGRNAVFVGLLTGLFIYLIGNQLMPTSVAIAIGVLAFAGATFWWYNEKRETIFVRDMLHGRYFKCGSIVQLCKKEDHLSTIVAIFRQVMESAKHWDDAERLEVEVLSKEEARELLALI